VTARLAIDASSVARRLERDTAIVLAATAVLALAFGGWSMAGGVLGGGLLAAVSYRTLKRGVLAIGPPAAGEEGRPAVSPARVAAGLAGRYALLLGVGYVIIGRLRLHPLGVLTGVSAVVVAAMVEAVRTRR
jgi:hypothetical protein